MNRYQIIDVQTGRKLNVIEWDGEAELGLPESQRVEPDDGAPIWAEPAPEPAPATVAEPSAIPPDAPTLSDWRVGLINLGRFDEVNARATAAHETGTTAGKIIWQRWEYANHVYRAELMELREAFGFTVDDVEDSLAAAAAVVRAREAATSTSPENADA